MNNELMQNEDFIRCSAMIAELLMKYKAMEDKDAREGGMQEDASCSLLFFRGPIEKSIVIVYTMNCRCLLLTKNLNGGSAVHGKRIHIYPCFDLDTSGRFFP